MTEITFCSGHAIEIPKLLTTHDSKLTLRRSGKILVAIH